jgi:5,5'-dehydrodivanillate O-demethylase oxygenase subunit
VLTHEQNERLTRVGPGTPCGELLRRYWQALCPVAEITSSKPKKRVRILGEDLVVYRSAEGELVCIEEHCSHRGVSLYRGFIEEGGIRCCYHGWKFDCSGRCIERPFETSETPAAANLRTYPVETLGGIAFAYMGPDPAKAPPLPRWDVLARTDRPRKILTVPIHNCNWLQIQENTVDSVHSYYLHGHLANAEGVDLQGGKSAFFYRHIVAYDWRTCEWGVEKVLKYDGAPEIEVRPPLIFPNVLRIPEGPRQALHFRIPVDDEHTRIIRVDIHPPESGEIVPGDETPFAYEFDPPDWDDDGELNTFRRQDRVAWETQGVIADRSREVLGASDRGIVLYRRMLSEQIDRVERGEAPTVAVVAERDRDRIIDFSQETLTSDWAQFKSRSMWGVQREPVRSV